jgi:hypothetical protein
MYFSRKHIAEQTGETLFVPDNFTINEQAATWMLFLACRSWFYFPPGAIVHEIVG